MSTSMNPLVARCSMWILIVLEIYVDKMPSMIDDTCRDCVRSSPQLRYPRALLVHHKFRDGGDSSLDHFAHQRSIGLSSFVYLL